MAAGGFHDQLGGGFHRYSVDERWCVPHFEKMSYDNSELLKNYLHGYQSLRLPHYKQVAEGLIDWVAEVLSDQRARRLLRQPGRRPNARRRWRLFHVDGRGGARRADAGGIAVIEHYFDVGPHGEMHHNPEKNVLWIALPIEEICQKLKMREDEVTLLLARAKAKLIAARRARRPTPDGRRNPLRRLECDVRFGVSRSRARARPPRLPRLRAENARPHASRSVGRIARLSASHRRTAPGRFARRSGLRRRRAARCV